MRRNQPLYLILFLFGCDRVPAVPTRPEATPTAHHISNRTDPVNGSGSQHAGAGAGRPADDRKSSAKGAGSVPGTAVASSPRPASEAISSSVGRVLETDTSPRGVCFTPDGRTLISGHWLRGRVVGWDVDAGRELRRYNGFDFTVESVDVSPDGKLVAGGGGTVVGGKQGVVRVWELESGKERAVFRGHTEWVRSVRFLPDGKRLAALSNNGSSGDIKVWDLTTGVASSVPGVGASMAIAPDGNVLAYTPSDFGAKKYKGVVLFDLRTSKETHVLAERSGSLVAAVAISPDGSVLALAGAGERPDRHSVYLYSIREGRELPPVTDGNTVWAGMRFSPDGTLLATTNLNGSVTIWDTTKWSVLHRFRAASTRAGRAVAWSPDGNRLAVGTGSPLRDDDRDGALEVWTLKRTRAD